MERAPPNRVDMPALVGEQPKGEEKEFKARNLYVLKSDIAKHGHTPLCPGCEAHMIGLPSRAHDEECRLRIQRKLMETDEGAARVKRAQERQEADYGKRAAKRPALEGRPPPDAPEVAAQEAAGSPLERPMEVSAERPGEQPQRGKKRDPGDIEDLYREEAVGQGSVDDAEVIPVSREVGSSGSGGANPVPDVSMPEVAEPQPAEPATEEAAIGLLVYERIKVKCTDQEAKTLFNLVGSLGADYTSEVPVNDGLCYNIEEKGVELHSEADVEKLFRELEQRKPILVMGLIPDGPFAAVQRRYNELEKATKEIAQRRLEVGRKELRTCIETYKSQVNTNKHYLQECPKGAKSWEHARYQSLSDETYVIEGPMCVWTIDKSGGVLAGSKFKKKTRWLTNSAAIASTLKKLCNSSSKDLTWKRTLTFEEGKVKAKLKYPPRLVNAIVRGIRAQLILDGELKEIGHVGGPDPHEEADYAEYHHDALPDATELYVKEPVIDANTGVILDPKKVAAARQQELTWVRKQEIYEKVPIDTCFQETNQPPITLKWVDRNKGDHINEVYRSRLVVREIKSKGRAALIPEHALFSAMPPLNAKIALFFNGHVARIAQWRQADLEAHRHQSSSFLRTFNTSCIRDIAEGDETPGACGLLKKTMYGTRLAA